MLQHTGNANLALEKLWKHVKPGGLLIVDRYQIGLRTTHPLKYFVRPILKRMDPVKVLSLAEKTCEKLVPLQRAALRKLKFEGLQKYWIWLISRSPNSTYPLRLEVEGKLSPEIAFNWSVLDTFDMWAPKFDSPVPIWMWKRSLTKLKNGSVIECGSCGQGNFGVVKRAS
jgi:hypothetical protein